MNGHVNKCGLGCESLEARDTPAGNVTAGAFGGAVFVFGDGDSNRVRIEEDSANNVFVIGLDGTTVNGQSVVFLGQGIPTSVFVDLGDGQDYLEMVHVYAGTINIQGGNGGDGLYLFNVSSAGNIEVNGGGDNDTLFVTGTIAGGALVIDGGADFDIVHGDTSGGYAGTWVVNCEAPF